MCVTVNHKASATGGGGLRTKGGSSQEKFGGSNTYTLPQKCDGYTYSHLGEVLL